MLSLRSFLAEPIQRFIDLRRLSGTDYHSQTLLLGAFDRFVAEQVLDEPRVTRQLVDAYQQGLSALAPRTRANRMCVVRQLCRYLAARDRLVYVPEPVRAVPSLGAHCPYIYSREEIQALLAAAAALPLPDSLRPYTVRTLLGLLYSTGLRIGEALALNLADFHPPQQRLFIAAGKFRKARWIPLAPSVCHALANYIQRRLQLTPLGPQAPLFINLRGHRLHHCSINRDFHRLLAQCGIARGEHTGARLHDLRHTFAVNRLLAWYREECDVNARLPALATYMGHVSIASTQLYLHPTAELLAQVEQ
ncbi:MAG: tyrosine-type recombinase/integrase, partial [Pseudomonadota bacterium]|nr:tyrosine-type recombinase/integrase [Pseudomonadota bacterium]